MKKILITFTIVLTLVTSAAVQADTAYTYEDAANEVYHALRALDTFYFGDIDYKELADAAIESIFEKLDRYTNYLTSEEFYVNFGEGQTRKTGIGVLMRTNLDEKAVVQEVFADSPAERADIRPGDIIIRVDGEDVTGQSLEAIAALITGDEGTTVSVVVLRDNREAAFDVIRGTFWVPLVRRVPVSSLISGADDNKTAYVELTSFFTNPENPAQDTGVQFGKILEDIKNEGINNLILDLRNNQGGHMQAFADISQMLVKEGIICTLIDDRNNTVVYRSTNAEPDFNLAVLVNGGTASAAEILAAAIKESGSGKLVGDTTYGKWVGQIIVPAYDDEHFLKISASEFLTRDGNRLNGIGVTPDILIPDPPVIRFSVTDEQDEDEIRQLASALYYLGYIANPDKDSLDTELQNALTLFQKDAGLPESGTLTLETARSINRFVAEKYLAFDEAINAAYKLFD